MSDIKITFVSALYICLISIPHIPKFYNRFCVNRAKRDRYHGTDSDSLSSQ